MTSSTEDYYRIEWIGNGDLSKDGTAFVYTRTHVEKPDREVNELILRNRADGTETCIGSGIDPFFSPDGRMVYCLKKENGLHQIAAYDIQNHRNWVLTTMRFGVSSPVLSPDGRFIAFLSNAEETCPKEQLSVLPAPQQLHEAERKRIEHPYVIFDDYGYKSDEYGGFAVGRYWTLWILDTQSGKVRMLSNGNRDHVMPFFSADSKTVYFVSNRERSREESIAMDLYKVPAEGGAIERLTKDDWIAYYPAPFQPLVSDDGSQIVYGALQPGNLFDSMPLTRLFSLKRGAEQPLSLWNEDAPCHEATCFLYNGENLGVEHRNTAVFDREGRYVYFISGWHGACNLYRACTDHAEITPVTRGLQSFRSIRRIGTEYLLSRMDFTHTPQLYLADEAMMRGEKEWNPRQLTNTNPWFEGMLSKPHEMWIKSLDGEADIQGFVFEPQNRKEGVKYPAVVYVHGGPTPFMGAALTYEHQCITGAGMGLIIMNFRGSSGYGEAFESMSKAQDGTAMSDILLYTRKACEAFDWIDEKRLGITGGSYGGWMTNWIAGHTNVFKAAVTQRSIANELIQYASSDMAGSSKDYESFRDFMKDELKKSPVSYVEHINMPFLILHGMNDMRCPVEQAHQLFSAVKETHPDQPVKMILFPGMNHEFPMSGPMDLRTAHYKAMIDWFRTYL